MPGYILSEGIFCGKHGVRGNRDHIGQRVLPPVSVLLPVVSADIANQPRGAGQHGIGRFGQIIVSRSAVVLFFQYLRLQVHICRSSDAQHNIALGSIADGRAQFHGPSVLGLALIDVLLVLFNEVHLLLRKPRFTFPGKIWHKPVLSGRSGGHSQQRDNDGCHQQLGNCTADRAVFFIVSLCHLHYPPVSLPGGGHFGKSGFIIVLKHLRPPPAGIL